MPPTGFRRPPAMTTESIYSTSHLHSTELPYPLIVVSLSGLTQINRVVTNDEVFDQALRKLDPLVSEGYVLVVLAAEGASEGKGKARDPGFAWWLSKWRSVPRKYRKNLKRMYLVHPSPFTRTLVPIILPFLSPKAYTKLHTVTSLFQLHTTYGISLSGIRLPLATLEEEARHRHSSPGAYATKSTGWATSLTSAIGWVGSYIPFSGVLASAASSEPGTSSDLKRPGQGYWNRTMDDLVESCDGVPPIFDILRQVILSECITTEGVFRRTPSPHLRPVIVDILDLPLNIQPILPWRDIAVSDPLLPPKILSRLLSQTSEPVIRPDQYKLVRQCTTVEHIKEIFLPSLSASTRLVLTHVVSTLHQVSQHSAENKMTPLNLAICIAPDLIRGPDAMEDASMCLQPGRKMPSQIGGSVGAAGDGTLVGILEIWIREFPSL